jgi:hypothetical protein
MALKRKKRARNNRFSSGPAASDWIEMPAFVRLAASAVPQSGVAALP